MIFQFKVAETISIMKLKQPNRPLLGALLINEEMGNRYDFLGIRGKRNILYHLQD